MSIPFCHLRSALYRLHLNTVVAAVEVAKVGAVAAAVDGVAAATVGGAGGDGDVSLNATLPDPNPPINYCGPTVPDCPHSIFAPAALSHR